ncbi:MAG: glycine betaine ABC transporter substrate-binding protein [Planctomycetia bacterium]
MFGRCWAAVAALVLAGGVAAADEPAPRVVVGSKAFTESVILGEMLVGLLRSAGVDAVHRAELGGSRIVWNALRAGEIDVYPEYTGTLGKELLGEPATDDLDEMRRRAAEQGVVVAGLLGFENTYALGAPEKLAAERGVKTLSDLARQTDWNFGLSDEFMNREDGWPGLKAAYGLQPKSSRGLNHDLAYRGVETGQLQVVDLYTTDAEIKYYKLRALVDDRGYFPKYQAVLLYRRELAERLPRATAAVEKLLGKISTEAMIACNARVKLEKVSEKRTAVDFLRKAVDPATIAAADDGGRPEWVDGLWRTTGEHLFLVGASLSLAIATAIPLGVLAYMVPWLARPVLGVVGVIQTLPSLALLVFMIPLLGLGAGPAIVALFLYSLLPIVRNTYTGLDQIPPNLHESADALGLSRWAKLRLVELPLASPSIMAGVKTAAVINVGTATIGALIGAGGYGQPILTGIRLDDHALILQGAAPAALLALAVQGAFGLAERWVVPRGLRLAAEAK